MRFILVLVLVAAASVYEAVGQYAQQGGKLIGWGALGIANQGQSLAISGDGQTAIIGGPFDSSGTGAAWVFTRTGVGWVQQGGKLVGAGSIDGMFGARQGTSVGLSADGNTAIIGGTGDNSGAGAAWIFVRSGGVWTQQGNKLVGSGAVDGFIGARQGESVSLSGDGNTAIVGGPLDSSGAGGAWIFTRSGGAWTQQGAKLVASTAVGEALQGWSVALSGDGSTAIVGGIYDLNNAGAAWIFVRANGTWTQQGFKLYGIDATQGANQGWSVALSGDGNTAVVGGIGDAGGTGAVWAFLRTNGVWSQQGGKIVGAGYSGSSAQGQSVSLSTDGNTAMLGGPGDSLSRGASWIFTRNAGTWSQQGSKLVGSGGVNGDYGSNQGGAVSLSSDGKSGLVGAPMDNAGAGASWLFVRNGTLWSQQGAKFVGSGARGNAQQGESVSVSSDGNTAIIGGPNDSIGVGAAWVFTRSNGTWGQQGSKLVGSGGIGTCFQATSVALSSDGIRAVIGAPGDSGGAGAAWVFARSSPEWQQEGTRLVGAGGINGTGGSRQGQSVSVSEDGSTLIIGGPGDSAGTGAAWVFTRSAAGWTQQAKKLVGTGAAGKAGQGESVSLSADGNTAIIGGPADSGGGGACWVFVRSAGAWSQQGGKISGTGATGNAGQGISVSLSSDGNSAAVGGAGDNSGTGAIWLFDRAGGFWSQSGRKLTGSDAAPSSGLGGAVSLSSDGNTVLAGGSNDAGGEGAIWVFTRSGGTWAQSGSKIVASGGAGNPNGGESVSLSGDGTTFIAGGPADNSGAGAAWVFARTTTGVEGTGPVHPGLFALDQNYPNPFNPATTIRFEIPVDGRVSLGVYNMLGEKVADLAEGMMHSGIHTLRFDASRLPSGVYICALRGGISMSVIKMLLVR